ncbi:EAL domain-containing protein [Subtercola boreus]|uniref:EAL domain-containing protein n=1 Tax=Subtercola boreus TaxID=120213 RepID=A0A3E0W6P0_9MICO|nr:EAL domain-containing protein [Subtercola boreus]RFA18116.1 hypothetical protein B7R24_15840 [Subtercola boreus]RFA18498.1 hypothetical protein B7R23_15875 [Subtercola boreus]RFA25026.1 hypothetical protein B7R25_15870 [Subtercola boreus]
MGELELDRIIAETDLTTVFQPIVDIETRRVVAFEALSRGPVGSELRLPDVLFPAAAARGLTTALDQACIAASLRAASGHELVAPFGLFLNVEAETIELLAARPPDRPVVIEVTERNLMGDPGSLMRSLRRLRAAGMLIAMDDVGTDPTSLALLPLLQPDIIKLDMSLLQKRPGRNAALVMDARHHLYRALPDDGSRRGGRNRARSRQGAGSGGDARAGLVLRAARPGSARDAGSARLRQALA